jgi:hypothetical protein
VEWIGKSDAFARTTAVDCCYLGETAVNFVHVTRVPRGPFCTVITKSAARNNGETLLFLRDFKNIL